MNPMSRSLPISVVIATHQRHKDLSETLLLLREREQVAEIIVVDNASTDGTSELIRKEFPEVSLIDLRENMGVPAFGVGVEAARQPFIFLLDDDAVPEPGTLHRAVVALQHDPWISVIACHIIDTFGQPVTDQWPPHPLLFWGCGACLRRETIVGLPYFFDPKLFLHGTEMDLAIRLYAKGTWIKYLPDAVVRHRYSPNGRSEAIRIYFLVHSAMRFALKHLPLKYALPACMRHLLVLLIKALNENCVGAYLLGLVSASKQINELLRTRQPVSRKIARIYYDQVWEYEPLARRIAQALTGRPLSRREKPLPGFPSYLTETNQ